MPPMKPEAPLASTAGPQPCTKPPSERARPVSQALKKKNGLPLSCGAKVSARQVVGSSAWSSSWMAKTGEPVPGSLTSPWPEKWMKPVETSPTSFSKELKSPSTRRKPASLLSASTSTFWNGSSRLLS